MVRNDLYISVPSYFRCPISLDVMKSPVSLCTGVTYDRTSIQRWLDGGNNTCPATMQVLQTKELVPNYTLQRLIKIWTESDSVRTRPVNVQPTHQPSSLTEDQVRQLINQLENELQKIVKDSSFQVHTIPSRISRLILYAKEVEENGKFLASAGARLLPLLIAALGNKQLVKDLEVLEKFVQFCNIILQQPVKTDSAERLSNSPSTSKIDSGKDFKSSMIMGLSQGRSGLRIAIAKLLEITSNLYLEVKILISEDDQIYSELLRLISSLDYNPDAMDSSLSCLICLALAKQNRAKIVRNGGVGVLAKALSESELSVPSTEKLLKLLEMVSTCKEGRVEICRNEICVEAIVKKVLKVSNVATEHAVTILWSLCCLFGDKKAQECVTKSNGMAKILVLMQSNCSGAVRQMSSDLLKIFRYKSKSCFLSCYDTKTTHIMPF
ncbi:U-box domain-containing protein 27-like [Olea europaea var. sylvestris]|uniref:U-box domain-containing protein 27-like n=1 Tax=Olea europaea var. sylvestris TaxID=158386 RepID=UPI000C1D7A2C|nr:U-box domain-containing protein 27-like [Olea europaea var. sylvestris]